MSAPRPVTIDLSAEERGVVLAALRMQMTKDRRTRAAIVRRFGLDADTSSKDRRLAIAESAYAKIHGGMVVDSVGAPGVPFTEEPRGGE